MSNTTRFTNAAVAVVATGALVLAVIALVTEGEDQTSRTIELVSVSDQRAEASADLGEQGDSAADLATFSEEARQDGRPVGRTFGSCTLAGTEREARGVCSLTSELEEGNIAAAGTIDFRREDQPQDIPIVGGTGERERHRDARTRRAGDAAHDHRDHARRRLGEPPAHVQKGAYE